MSVAESGPIYLLALIIQIEYGIKNFLKIEIHDPIRHATNRLYNKLCYYILKFETKSNMIFSSTVCYADYIEKYNRTLEQTDMMFRVLDQKKNIFITGEAGSGKTFLANRCIEYIEKVYPNFNVCNTSTTGVSAVDSGGITLHSWAGILTPTLCKTLEQKRNYKELAQIEAHNLIQKKNTQTKAFMTYERWTTENLVLRIDEISMISEMTLAFLDWFGRSIRGVSHLHFGGIIIIASGDFFQLPPIPHKINNKEIESSKNFCFEYEEWPKLFPFVINLEFPRRQMEDLKYFEIVSKIGKNLSITPDELKSIKSRTFNNEDVEVGKELLKIFPTKLEAAGENERALKILDSPLEKFQRNISVYRMIKGTKTRVKEFDEKSSIQVEEISKTCPLPQIFELKVGIPVMMTSNILMNKHGVVNGSRGTFKSIKPNGDPIVYFNRIDKEISIEKQTWRSPDGDLIVECQQYPLCQANAITIHKSQGSTVQGVAVYLGKIFAEGQMYVALTRVKCLDDLIIVGDVFLHNIKTNEKVIKWYSENFEDKMMAITVDIDRSIVCKEIDIFLREIDEIYEIRILKKRKQEMISDTN